MNADVDLMLEVVFKSKNVIMISVNVNVKNKKNIAYVKTIIPGILVNLLASVIRIVTCDTGQYRKDCTSLVII